MDFQNTFFTSDTHFEHKNILTFCPETRQGKDATEMTEIMIEAWNKKVKPTDRVYHLGDFSFGTVARTMEICGRLNGFIYLIKGNHDKVVTNDLIRERFTWIKDYAGVKIGDTKIVMMHYPIESWDRMHHGVLHFHGHLHGDSHHECRVVKNRIDVGIDTRKDKEMAPWHFDELLERVQKEGN